MPHNTAHFSVERERKKSEKKKEEIPWENLSILSKFYDRTSSLPVSDKIRPDLDKMSHY